MPILRSHRNHSIMHKPTATLTAALAAGLALAASTLSAAAAGPAHQAATALQPGLERGAGAVQTIGYRRYYRDDYRTYERRRYHYRDRYDYDAPYVRHYGRHYGRTRVDAPYAHVHRDRHGVHVRAPYVNIYIPRY